MQLQPASRKNVKIRMALQGPSGSGKTYSSLLVAYGLTGDWSSIAVIDTENHSSELYAHLGSFKVLHLDAPFTPERYIEALLVCEREQIEVAIIDSISHEWEGSGGILEEHSNMLGNSYTNWSKLTPRHNEFVQYMLQSPMHIIGTIRAKQDYVLSEKNGKQVPEKVGMKGVTRDGMDYEFTLVFELNIKNKAVATKDRTSLFFGKPERILTPEVGKQILQWCNLGIPEPVQNIFQRVNKCMSIGELLHLYQLTIPEDEEVKQAFTNRRLLLENSSTNPSFTNIQNTSNNGTHNTNQQQ
jgi:hypothetical protein